MNIPYSRYVAEKTHEWMFTASLTISALLIALAFFNLDATPGNLYYPLAPQELSFILTVTFSGISGLFLSNHFGKMLMHEIHDEQRHQHRKQSGLIAAINGVLAGAVLFLLLFLLFGYITGLAVGQLNVLINKYSGLSGVYPTACSGGVVIILAYIGTMKVTPD